MTLYQTIFEVIDMRSFSNLWYWIALAVLWSTASHFVLGVPFDLAIRARKQGGQAMQDLTDLVRINVGRITNIAEVSGTLLVAMAFFVNTVLALLGFVYHIEFAQALVLMSVPMSLVLLLSVRAARRIRATQPAQDDLVKALAGHRRKTQIIGMIAIVVTAMFGMWQNIITPIPV